jgi:hypothetical protein
MHVEPPKTRSELVASQPKPRWYQPLGDFLGDEEPSDDDAEDWIIRDVIPRGEPWLFAGPPKSGKTWSALDLALSCATGNSWLGAFENTMGRPAKTFLVLMEDSKRRKRKRLWELARGRGWNPNDLKETLVVAQDEPLSLPGDEKRFALELKAWGAEVVIVDNLTRAMIGDPNSTKDAKRFSQIWMQVGTYVGASVGFLHHTAKPPQDGKDQRAPHDRMRGSGDFRAMARHALVSEPLSVKGQKLSVVSGSGNLDLRRELFVLGFERTQRMDGRWEAVCVDKGDPAALVEQAQAARSEQRRAKRISETEQTWVKALKIARDRGSCSITTLAVVAGIPETAAERALKGAQEEGLLTAGKGGRHITEAGLKWLADRGVS